MIFTETPIKGLYLIDPEKIGDSRGFFARLFCAREFGEHGLETRYVQANSSLSVPKGTLRGLHYQLPPNAETKVMRCISGALLNVIVDLRKDSPTFKEYFAAELTSENRRMTYIPKGCANSFLTLEDNTEVIYLVSEFYAPEMERGIRWNDPEFDIEWPFEPVVISEKDQNHPDFDPAYHLPGL